MQKRLYRSRTERMIWGVCGGLAEYFNVDPTIVRVIAVLSVLVSGLGILAYIILAIVIPLESSQAAAPKDVIRENVEEMKETASGLGREIRDSFARKEGSTEGTFRAHHRGGNIIGIILILVGLFLLLGRLDVFWWLRWGYIWPLIIVAIGVLVLLSAKRK